jgi:polyphosphate kinase 1
MTNQLYAQGFTQNRELSWLKFNHRVLEEAMDETVPLLERLKFISIFTANLDEFFMIRVGSLYDLSNVNKNSIDNKSGMTVKQQLDSIYDAVRPMYKNRDQVFFEVEHQLRMHGIYNLSYAELEPPEQKFVKNYFKNTIAPILSPQIVDSHHPFPHLQNKVIHIGAMLRYKSKEVFSVVPVPAVLPEIVFLPGNEVRYIKTADIILENIKQVYSLHIISEKVLLCITRNADINPDDESFEIESDFRKKMKKIIGQRKRLAPVRLELSSSISPEFSSYLSEHLSITTAQMFISETPMSLGYAFSLASKVSDTKKRVLTYRHFTPQLPSTVNMNDSIIKQVLHHDILLSYPYESMEPFLQMIREAANDSAVVSIKITIYRLASKAKLVEYICAAAEAGKDVTVIIELRARFDEQNNIDWSERLEDAGCKVIYGFEDYKIHSKICLITRRERNEIKYITQVGTGNYNEKTAEIYTDLSVLTANNDIGRDANEFFKNMAIGNLEGHYQHLLVAPASLKSTIIQLIDNEIAKGDSGYIFLKLNSITDLDIIDKLKQASCAGVTVKMVVRGICCIVPGIKGKTENISITSIVGRFLEHSRIYCFGSGNSEKIYISSADFMTRNTERRVEIACPIYDEESRSKIHTIIEATEYDNLKARVLLSDGNYAKKDTIQFPIDSQQLLMNLEEEKNTTKPSALPSDSILHKFQRWVKKILLKFNLM